jgi:hypothetical protein
MTVTWPANYIEARRALAAAYRVDEVKNIRDKAKAMEVYAAQAKDGMLIAHATEIRMRAEIRASELLAQMAKQGERDRGKAAKGLRVATPTNLPTLSDLGVNKTQSSRWQKLAAKPPEKQEQTIRRRVQVAVAAAEDDKAVVSAARAERQADKRKRRNEREQALAGKQQALPQKKYGVIYADAEWRFEPWSQHETGMDRAADNHYPTSDLEAIKARDVQSIAAADCILFLWATAEPPPLVALSCRSEGQLCVVLARQPDDGGDAINAEATGAVLIAVPLRQIVGLIGNSDCESLRLEVGAEGPLVIIGEAKLALIMRVTWDFEREVP